MSAAGELGGDLKKQLQQIAKDYPAVRIDRDPLPKIEKRKRAAISKDRSRYFAPFVGRGGREYELTVLGKRYDAIYERTYALLQKEYFKNPTGKSKD